MKKNETILLGHGSGGKMTHDLIDQLFARYFDNPILRQQSDSAILDFSTGKLAFTTDSFVVDPVFFPGGNIGHLAVAGTVNDMAVSGAVPLYLSAGFILEEGFPMESLEIIVRSMAEEAKKAGVSIVTGDTKVVNRGQCDKLFINTSGIGRLEPEYEHISSGINIRPGDKIIINGSIGDHGMAIMSARNELKITTKIESDCACLNHLISESIMGCRQIRFMRDATRGGLGTVVAELVKGKSFGLKIDETKLQIRENVRGLCEMLGFDPLYVANEGKVVMVAGADEAGGILKRMKQHPLGTEASIIGEITTEHQGIAWLETVIGGKRIIDMLSGNQLPRIC
ncbi:MAG: hydrogenase expression/formation protein HypE [Bacteroidetes bacterium GWF2_41_31]|nr:MAG: hydrogenase expression/formation protein HypE [Bacteroidetes bacterium GWF2_41_31]OFZ03316.1 MAG: hydrogenase expression/formation protein HypE [Bacteroidetes bacterium RIFOXYB12_FULL_41_6]